MYLFLHIKYSMECPVPPRRVHSRGQHKAVGASRKSFYHQVQSTKAGETAAGLTDKALIVGHIYMMAAWPYLQL